MKYIFSLIIIMSFSMQIFADDDDLNCLIEDKKGAYREHNVDFLKLELDVKFNTKQSRIEGFAKYTFEPIRENVTTLFLDAPSIKFISIKMSGKEIKYREEEGGITLLFDKPLDWHKTYKLLIKYGTRPKKGLYFVGWNDPTKRSRKQIWTQGQGIDNRHWIPGFDAPNDKLITETIITFDSKYEVISNGKLKFRRKNNNRTTTWHYAMEKPHSLYLIMIAIGEYEFRDYASNSKIISRQYFYPDKKDAEETTYQYTNKMMNWCEEEFGVPYQWEIYKNVPVQDFMYGAMENTSATIFTDYYLQDKRQSLERNYIGTNIHELVHNWFGDLITEWGGKDHWLHESFATHYSKYFRKDVLGEDEYDWIRHNEKMSALRASEKNDLPIAHSGSGSARHYPKGSFVIDMLRDVVGEAEFKKTIKEYLERYSFDMVDTHDFQNAFMRSVGMNLDWFFNQWIYKGGEPEYEINYKKRMGKTIIYVDQIHEMNSNIGTFKMPIKFQVHYKDNSFDEVTEWIENKKDTVIIPNKALKKVEYILFDPNAQVLKKVKFERNYNELFLQATKAKNLLDRYEAVKAMESIEVEKKREDLIDMYLEEDFKMIKMNILKQLTGDEHSKTEQLYVYGMGEKDPSVRRIALKYADISNKRYIKFYEEMLSDESVLNVEKALEKLCYEYPNNQQEYLNRTRHIADKYLNVKLAWLKVHFEDNKKLYSGITDYSSESFDFRTRIKAMNILNEKDYFDNAYMKNVINAYLSFNRRLRKTAHKELVRFLEFKETGILTSKYIRDNKWFPEDEKALDELLVKYNRKVYK